MLHWTSCELDVIDHPRLSVRQRLLRTFSIIASTGSRLKASIIDGEIIANPVRPHVMDDVMIHHDKINRLNGQHHVIRPRLD